MKTRSLTEVEFAQKIAPIDPTLSTPKVGKRHDKESAPVDPVAANKPSSGAISKENAIRAIEAALFVYLEEKDSWKASRPEWQEDSPGSMSGHLIFNGVAYKTYMSGKKRIWYDKDDKLIDPAVPGNDQRIIRANKLLQIAMTSGGGHEHL